MCWAACGQDVVVFIYFAYRYDDFHYTCIGNTLSVFFLTHRKVGGRSHSASFWIWSQNPSWRVSGRASSHEMSIHLQPIADGSTYIIPHLDTVAGDAAARSCTFFSFCHKKQLWINRGVEANRSKSIDNVLQTIFVFRCKKIPLQDAVRYTLKICNQTA